MRVWVDCTAAPHPLVLRPIIEGLRERGHQVEITAREYGQTEGVLNRLGLEHKLVGRHAGAGRARKSVAVGARSARLARWARGRGFDVSLGHGSVDIAVVSRLLRIASVQMQDYEYAGSQRRLAWRVAKRVLVPDLIPVERLVEAGASEEKLVRFPGLKEDYYLADFTPDPAVISEAGLHHKMIRPDRLRDERLLVVMRPPPEDSAYHAENTLFDGAIDRVLADARSVVVLFPRTEGQRRWAAGLDSLQIVVPEQELDAQSLIAYSDLVISAGGTMNREAVALGVPAYTAFSGRMGGVDEALIADGRLRLLADPADVELVKREGSALGPVNPRDAGPLVDAVEEAAG